MFPENSAILLGIKQIICAVQLRPAPRGNLPSTVPTPSTLRKPTTQKSRLTSKQSGGRRTTAQECQRAPERASAKLPIAASSFKVHLIPMNLFSTNNKWTVTIFSMPDIFKQWWQYFISSTVPNHSLGVHWLSIHHTGARKSF